MRRKWLIGGGLVLVAAAGVGGAFVSGAIPLRDARQDKKAEVTLAFAPHEVVRPQRAAMPDRIEFSGPLVAPGTAVVRSRAAGTLLSLEATEGVRVRAGQVLGRVDLAEASSRVAERDANVAAARAALAQAERTHASNERLAAQQFISPIALDNSRAALASARAALDAAQAAGQTARVGLRDATLVAPIGGIVAKRHALPGEKLSPEQQVVTIVDLRRLELAGNVGTHEVSRLAAGMPVQVQVEGLERVVEGRIARIAPAAVAGTRSIGVTIELDNPDERMRAGQYAQARVTLPDETLRLTVPGGAVAQASGQDQVWVIEQGVLARRAVTLGRRDPHAGRVEVLQGLPEDALVLAARFENLKEGSKASVGTAAPAAVASTAASAPTQLK